MNNPHFPGSFPLATAQEVFTWVGRTLGERARLVPDGETGEQRKDWMPYLPWLQNNPTLEQVDPLAEIPEGQFAAPLFRVKSGEAATFGRFDFADWARDSYEAFKRVRGDGVLPRDAKFVVTLPHSIDAMAYYSEPGSYEAIYDAYVVQHRASVDEILDSIPHNDLAIQWDIPQAVILWTEYPDEMFRFGDKQTTLASLVEHARWVPEDVELGYHLCFGDGGGAEDDPSREGVPDDRLASDFTEVVELANAMTSVFERRIDFLHLPTYRHWLTPQQYEPLVHLQGDDSTEISIGVINLRRDAGLPLGDAISRSHERMVAAREAIGASFGVATTCGMGRLTPEQFDAAGQLYADLDRELHGS